MADGANNKLAQVRTKDNLKRDAEVGKRNKAGVGKRTANVGGGGSLPINRGMNVSRIMGNLSSNSTQQDIEAKKRLNRANRAIQIAEKIPYINKYAKVVKKATQAAEKVQNVKGGIGSFFKGSSDSAPSAEDIKEAQEAEERGEEYDPEAKEKRQTAITKRQTIILAVLISSGLLISILFLGVILMSSMTDTGGKYYLASKENPSEEDLEKAYNAQNGDSSGNVTSSGRLKADGTFEPDDDKYDSVVELTSEPKPWTAINYWDNLDKNDFIYPKDSKTGKYLGAWPKNYSSIPTQLSGCKSYQKYFAWPTTPSNGVYNFVYNHPGIDIMADFGNPIYSPVDGKLVFSAWGDTHNTGSDETAYSITISPNNGTQFNGINVNEVYMTHMSGIVNRCERGECNKTVKQGELIGFVGNAAGSATSEGYATHLHMTLYPSGNYYGGLDTYGTEDFYGISSGTSRKVCE